MKKQNLAISGIGTFPVLLLLFSVFLHPAAYAADVPHTFSNGTAANADEVNANFKNLSDRSWNLTTKRVNPVGAACPVAPAEGVDCVCPTGSVWVDDVTADGLLEKQECKAMVLEAQKEVFRKIAHASANGPNDNTNTGQIVSRVLSFSKIREESKIRIGYTDSLRVVGPGKACRWEIRVDGEACPAQPLVFDFYAALPGENTHRSRSVVGYCGGVSPGLHEIQVWVGPVSVSYRGSDCFTGWSNSTWTIEAEEVY